MRELLYPCACIIKLKWAKGQGLLEWRTGRGKHYTGQNSSYKVLPLVRAWGAPAPFIKLRPVHAVKSRLAVWNHSSIIHCCSVHGGGAEVTPLQETAHWYFSTEVQLHPWIYIPHQHLRWTWLSRNLWHKWTGSAYVINGQQVTHSKLFIKADNGAWVWVWACVQLEKLKEHTWGVYQKLHFYKDS